MQAFICIGLIVVIGLVAVAIRWFGKKTLLSKLKFIQSRITNTGNESCGVRRLKESFFLTPPSILKMHIDKMISLGWISLSKKGDRVEIQSQGYREIPQKSRKATE